LFSFFKEVVHHTSTRTSLVEHRERQRPERETRSQSKCDEEKKDKEKEEEEPLSGREKVKADRVVRWEAFGPVKVERCQSKETEMQRERERDREGETHKITSSLDPVSTMTGMPSCRGVPIPMWVMYWIPITACRETSDTSDEESDDPEKTERGGGEESNSDSLSFFQVLRFCSKILFLIGRETMRGEAADSLPLALWSGCSFEPSAALSVSVTLAAVTVAVVAAVTLAAVTVAAVVTL
jgi:hypothetical protein